MLLADDNRNYIDVNPAAERLVRRSREVLVTLRIDDLRELLLTLRIKLGAKTRAHAITLAISRGLIRL